MKIKWAYGVTTVPQRVNDLLPSTLASLARGGFDKPVLFIDGDKNSVAYTSFGLDYTLRFPSIRTAGNWTLSMLELYIRNPEAHRYALFQDDMVTYHNLRQYLEGCEYPAKGYWNLYTFPKNQKLAPSPDHVGWYPSNQRGLGAVAIVLSREALITLFRQPHFLNRAQDCHRGHRSIDGGIATAFTKAGWREYVHSPSLVQHTGKVSAMKNSPHQQAPSFRGENFDALEL